MAKFMNGEYRPRNVEKYRGSSIPRYRSSWELTMMRFLDNNPAVLEWQSEGLQIPYRNPLTGKGSVYVPDFLVVYQDKRQKLHAEMLEVKPHRQTTLEAAGKSQHNRMHAMINAEKWRAAAKWCAQRNIRFRVVTEQTMFFNGGAK